MSQPRDSVPSAADLAEAVRVKGRCWLDGRESESWLGDL